MTTPRKLHIKNASWIVAYDKGQDSHTYLKDADAVVEGDVFTQVGGKYTGPVDEVIDGSGLMLMPGLVNVHSHPSSEPGNKGLLEELGSPRLGQSGLYEFMPVFRLPSYAAPAASQVAVSELLKSGVTTFTDLSGAREGWGDELAATGIRAVLCPMYRDAVWSTKDGHSVVYDWDVKAGEKAMEQAVEVCDAAEKHESGRLSGMLGPSQIDTCTAELLQATMKVAKERGIKVQLHAAQSVVEFNEITRRYGMTPIEWLDHVGILEPNLIVAHGIFLNDHPWIKWPQADDFSLLSDSGAQVAHCPNVFVRRGIALNAVRRYQDAGITVGLGTDTFPHNMIDEMRTACHAARVLRGDFTACSTADIFRAATLDGAKMLGRDDIGRVAKGAKADFSLVDVDHPYMRPVREPLRSLIFSASDRAIKDVYVAGEKVVADGEVLRIDVDKALTALSDAQAETIKTVHERDWAERSVNEMTPMVFPVFGEND